MAPFKTTVRRFRVFLTEEEKNDAKYICKETYGGFFYGPSPSF
jgi:hypothetical protein